jgi:hypothetical protein
MPSLLRKKRTGLTTIRRPTEEKGAIPRCSAITGLRRLDLKAWSAVRRSGQGQVRPDRGGPAEPVFSWATHRWTDHMASAFGGRLRTRGP